MGVPGVDAARLRDAIGARLPENIANADVGMDEYLRVFEELVPIEWHDDMTVAPRALREELEQRLKTILERTHYPVSPTAVAAEMVVVAREVLGSALDDALVANVAKSLHDVLVSWLWRCRDDEARTELAEHLARSVAQYGRIAFDAPP